MKNSGGVLLVVAGMLLAIIAWNKPQEEWPVVINSSDGSIIKIYQPVPESFADNVLKARAAISVQTSDTADPVFGTFWTIAKVETDRDNRRVIIQSVKVPNIKLAEQKQKKIPSNLKTILETQLPEVAGDLSLDDLLSQLELSDQQKKLSKDLNTAAPRIIYTSRPNLLVLIDGSPKLQHNADWNVDVVVNTPFTMVKNSDNTFYLYGSKRWYTAPAATGPYSLATNVPGSIGKIEKDLKEASNANPGYDDPTQSTSDNTPPSIIVSTQPAELIQTDGPPNFVPIDSTNLSYVSNSGNDVFMDLNTHQYYVLLSGRWYTSPSLRDHWQYVPSDKLPEDFARIPEGSPKDNVLASVAGTEAAREAIMDAQIPQTAKVDRNKTSTKIEYNGAPRFQPIPGTDLQYAANTSSPVILYRGIYYTVDNGVWFQSRKSPEGPWTVSTTRPDEVERIPPTSPLYNIKYVYIYDVTPDYVYMGYTPGYLNTYILGPTIVYGTGFYYNPWFDGFYYTRPWTWGFGMSYNPWVGWSMGYGYSLGWLNISIGYSRPGYWYGGWWGPRIYHPPYAWSRYRSYGYYGNNFYKNYNSHTRIINNYTTNIYVNRPGVETRNNRPAFNNNFNNPGRQGMNNANPNRYGVPNGSSIRQGMNQNRPPQNQTGTINQGNRPNMPTRPPSQQSTPNNIFPDRNGNVFQRNPNNNQVQGQDQNRGQNVWQQRQSNQWRNLPNNNQTIPQLNREQQMRERGQMRTQNFERVQRNSNQMPSMRQAPQRSMPATQQREVSIPRGTNPERGRKH